MDGLVLSGRYTLCILASTLHKKVKEFLLTQRSTSKDLGNEFEIESFGVIND